jgi:hypothetical protein
VISDRRATAFARTGPTGAPCRPASLRSATPHSGPDGRSGDPAALGELVGLSIRSGSGAGSAASGRTGIARSCFGGALMLLEQRRSLARYRWLPLVDLLPCVRLRLTPVQTVDRGNHRTSASSFLQEIIGSGAVGASSRPRRKMARRTVVFGISEVVRPRPARRMVWWARPGATAPADPPRGLQKHKEGGSS